METVLQKKASPVRQLSVGPRLCSGLHLASKEQREISPGDSWGDSLANPTAACRRPGQWIQEGGPVLGSDQGLSSKEWLFLGCIGVGPAVLFSARDTVCPPKWLYLEGGSSGPAGTPPAPVQVLVQLCKKCRAWKSLGR